jgi:hypothetical protein
MLSSREERLPKAEKTWVPFGTESRFTEGEIDSPERYRKSSHKSSKFWSSATLSRGMPGNEEEDP